MRSVFLLFACVSISEGQVTVSFASTGAETLRSMTGVRIKGVQIVSVEVCNAGSNPIVMAAGRVYQAGLLKGVPLISPLAAPSVLTRANNRNIAKILMDGGGTVTGAASVLLVSKVIVASSGWATGLVIASQIAPMVSAKLADRVPDTSVFLMSILKDTLNVAPAECASRLALAEYSGKMSPVVTTIEDR